MADLLAGASLDHQAHEKRLREEVRASVVELEGSIRALMQASQALAGPRPDPEAADLARLRVAAQDREREQIERWLRGEDTPDEPGVSRTALRIRLTELARERRGAALLIQAHELEGEFERGQLRAELIGRVEALRDDIKRITEPVFEALTGLDAIAAERSGPFAEALAAFGRSAPAGPAAGLTVRAAGWFQHGQVSLRWTNKEGRLIATAQVRVRPSTDPEPAPPLLMGRFAIDAHTDQDATVSVGHFLIAFHVSADELKGEPRVLEALTQLLDLEALASVRPERGPAGQN